MKAVVMLLFTFMVLHDVVDGVIKYDSVKINDINAANDDYFGCAVGINENTIVVGSYGDDENGKSSVGSINVYSVNGTTLKLVNKITPSEGKAGDYFGNSVALNTKYIVVGSKKYDKGNTNNAGGAYIYSYKGNTPVLSKKIVAEDGARSDWFGTSVAINDENTVVVGAPEDDDKGSGSGSVYVFPYTGVRWLQNQQKKLVASNLHADSSFGTAVAITNRGSLTNSYIAVGAEGQKYNDMRSSGQVYIYEQNDYWSQSTWSQQTTINSPNAQRTGFFGCSVSTYGERIVIGAYGEDSWKGRAYVYIPHTWRGSSGWKVEATLTASDRDSYDKFGVSVSINKDTIVIGAQKDFGRAYVFERINGKWKEVGKLVAKDGKEFDSFGDSVSTFNGKIVVGSAGNDAKGKDSGAVYIFNPPPVTPPPPTTTTTTTTTTTATLPPSTTTTTTTTTTTPQSNNPTTVTTTPQAKTAVVTHSNSASDLKKLNLICHKLCVSCLIGFIYLFLV